MTMVTLVPYPHTKGDQARLIRAGVRACIRAERMVPKHPYALRFRAQIAKDPALKAGDSVSEVEAEIIKHRGAKYPARVGIDVHTLGLDKELA